MRILVIGATGTIGRAVTAAFGEAGHEVVRASRGAAEPELRVDMADPASVAALLAAVGEVDAVVCCAASGALVRITEGADAEFLTGLDGKLLGQVLLVRQALRWVRDGGSVTLTSGVFDEPLPGASFGALVNAGLEAFVAAVAGEMPRGIRVNAVGPGWVAETLALLGRDPAAGTPVAGVAGAYVAAVSGTARGRTFRPGRG
ncbi:short chain dehydrogenase [Streptomyces litchfieldiae]|uniref:Short chain dehydrogenase n=1 Tax=Streptomyces litchfieldiae TaxID=3075543 RepID=A0ABU2ML17_9ACTN|nr:short chain dehydrogenase [Streptomyces sp. DSM 44938]MDT0342180.1 short chain dehydrogenase [Streptomyces sp. DSM 44938]